MAQRIDLVGRKLLLFSLLLLLNLSVARRILVIGGDWVAHPSNTVARRILMTNSFLVAMSGVGSPEPPGIRMNNFILCPRSLFSGWTILHPLSNDHWKQK
jgi:hypothetical protein